MSKAILLQENSEALHINIKAVKRDKKRSKQAKRIKDIYLN